MSNMVMCAVLNTQSEALPRPPYPGEIGERIFKEVSAAGWKRWLEHLVLLINENQLNSSNPQHLKLIEQQMLQFLFNAPSPN